MFELSVHSQLFVCNEERPWNFADHWASGNGGVQNQIETSNFRTRLPEGFCGQVNVNGTCQCIQHIDNHVNDEHAFEIKIEIIPIFSLSKGEVFKPWPDEGEAQTYSFKSADTIGTESANYSVYDADEDSQSHWTSSCNGQDETCLDRRRWVRQPWSTLCLLAGIIEVNVLLRTLIPAGIIGANRKAINQVTVVKESVVVYEIIGSFIAVIILTRKSFGLNWSHRSVEHISYFIKEKCVHIGEKTNSWANE